MGHGGGNTKSMLAVWKDWGLVEILKEAYKSGTIMCGVSAGAICWFEYGITDSWEGELKIINCLGFVSGSCCPHYDEEPKRKPSLKKFLNEGALENCNLKTLILYMHLTRLGTLAKTLRIGLSQRHSAKLTKGREGITIFILNILNLKDLKLLFSNT